VIKSPKQWLYVIVSVTALGFLPLGTVRGASPQQAIIFDGVEFTQKIMGVEKIYVKVTMVKAKPPEPKPETVEKCHDFLTNITPRDINTLFDFARCRVDVEFGEGQWGDFKSLVQKESSWEVGNINPSSGACGLGQALPCSKPGNGLGDPVAEVNWVINYIKNRYNTPSEALYFWMIKAPQINGNNWY
jgi:hypothetical protein